VALVRFLDGVGNSCVLSLQAVIFEVPLVSGGYGCGDCPGGLGMQGR